MSEAVKDWFEIERENCPNEATWTFISALCEHSSEWIALGISPQNGFFQADDGLITLGISISDEERRCIVRDLRIDFDGSRVVMGEDETHQYVTDLVPGERGAVEHRLHDAAPHDYAQLAAAWLATETRRIIERHEWHRLTYRHTKWMMADTGKCIVWSDTHNEKRSDLGPPTHVTVIHPRLRPTESSGSEKEGPATPVPLPPFTAQ